MSSVPDSNGGNAAANAAARAACYFLALSDSDNEPDSSLAAAVQETIAIIRPAITSDSDDLADVNAILLAAGAIQAATSAIALEALGADSAYAASLSVNSVYATGVAAAAADLAQFAEAINDAVGATSQASDPVRPAIKKTKDNAPPVGLQDAEQAQWRSLHRKLRKEIRARNRRTPGSNQHTFSLKRIERIQNKIKYIEQIAAQRQDV